MRNYQFHVSVQQTRLYTITADSLSEAEEILGEEYETLDHDVIETEIDTTELQDD